MCENRYVLISPCRNEAEFMRKTLDSVVSQSPPPSEWVIVDDGSTDETPEILKEYASNYPFIRIVTRKDRGFRKVGPGVVDAFYAGLETVDLDQFDFLCKLDLDLILPDGYFGTLIERMQQNPKVGTCSGKLYYVSNKTEGLISEKCGDENSIGPTKFYRKQCFEQIGGFIHEVMWDGIDGHKCREMGWIAISWDTPDLRVTHLRPMGSSQKNILVGRMRSGFGQHFMGTGFVYMLVSATYRMTRPPFIIGGMAMILGYVKSEIQGLPQLKDKELSRFIRKYQWQCLLMGKKKATKLLNIQREKYWHP